MHIYVHNIFLNLLRISYTYIHTYITHFDHTQITLFFLNVPSCSQIYVLFLLICIHTHGEREREVERERERNSVEFPSTRNVPLRRQRSLNETLSAGYGILPLQ